MDAAAEAVGGIKSHKKHTRGMTKASGSADPPSKMKDSNPVSDTGVPATTTTKPSQGAKAAARSAGWTGERNQPRCGGERLAPKEVHSNPRVQLETVTL